MKVFLTGASGFIGTHVIPELISHGHTVLGLARSAQSADKIAKLGAEVHHGSLTDLDSLRSGAIACEAVIHAGFTHDWDNFEKACAQDLAAVRALGEALVGSNKPYLVSGGIEVKKPAEGLVTEEMRATPGFSLRVLVDEAALEFATQGVKVAIMRLASSVHGKGDPNFVPHLLEAAKKNRESIHIGDGQNVWASAHINDVAILYRLVLEQVPIGGTNVHVVAESGVQIKKLAEVIGKKVGVQAVSKTAEEARPLIGWLTNVLQFDKPTSSEITQKAFGWTPNEIGLLEDIEENY